MQIFHLTQMLGAFIHLNNSERKKKLQDIYNVGNYAIENYIYKVMFK